VQIKKTFYPRISVKTCLLDRWLIEGGEGRGSKAPTPFFAVENHDRTSFDQDFYWRFLTSFYASIHAKTFWLLLNPAMVF
jgi:hypothetical protein